MSYKLNKLKLSAPPNAQNCNNYIAVLLSQPQSKLRPHLFLLLCQLSCSCSLLDESTVARLMPLTVRYCYKWGWTLKHRLFASLYFCSGRRISVWLFVVNFNFIFSIGQRFRAGHYKISHLQQYLPVVGNFNHTLKDSFIELNHLK